jgi:hypothetical protein
MKKAKKTKVLRRRSELDRLAAQVRKVLRRTTRDAIEIGNLLIKSRKYLEHGEWMPWLAENFDLSYRTAVNYCDAAEYVAQKCNVADFTNLSSSVLYWLAAGHYSAEEEAAILAATREGRVDETRVAAICDALAPPDDDAADDDREADGDDDAKEAPPDPEIDPEIEAILDGPPPPVPPPAPLPPPPDFALRDFDQAISVLKRLMTKSSVQFASTIHSANDLETVEAFIHAVTKAKAALLDATEDAP